MTSKGYCSLQQDALDQESEHKGDSLRKGLSLEETSRVYTPRPMCPSSYKSASPGERRDPASSLGARECSPRQTPGVYDRRGGVISDLENQTDEAIFAAFQRGNVSALGTIYDRYGLLVYRLVYRMLNNSQEAEDLTQEIFLSLQERPQYNPQRGSFYTYLMILARSRTIDRLRSKRSHGRFLQNIGKMKDLIGKSNHVNPTEIVAINERAKQVRAALKHLSSNQRQVLELSYYQGLSQSEIAERLNLPLGTVKTHSRRGLLKLRKNLQNIVN